MPSKLITDSEIDAAVKSKDHMVRAAMMLRILAEEGGHLPIRTLATDHIGISARSFYARSSIWRRALHFLINSKKIKVTIGHTGGMHLI